MERKDASASHNPSALCASHYPSAMGLVVSGVSTTLHARRTAWPLFWATKRMFLRQSERTAVCALMIHSPSRRDVCKIAALLCVLALPFIQQSHWASVNAIVHIKLKMR